VRTDFIALPIARCFEKLLEGSAREFIGHLNGEEIPWKVPVQ